MNDGIKPFVSRRKITTVVVVAKFFIGAPWGVSWLSVKVRRAGRDIPEENVK